MLGLFQDCFCHGHDRSKTGIIWLLAWRSIPSEVLGVGFRSAWVMVTVLIPGADRLPGLPMPAAPTERSIPGIGFPDALSV